MARENAQAVPSGTLWERDAELAAVTAAVDGLCEGHDTGSLLVFTGEAGIGKTAVLGEVERVAVTLGLRGTALSEVVEGLAEGDAVLAADAEPGQRVRLREQPLPAGVTE